LDVTAVRRRGRLGTWFDTITGRLSKLYGQTGTGLAGAPARRTLLDASLVTGVPLPYSVLLGADDDPRHPPWSGIYPG